jgi:hypothetical protein
MLNVLLPIGIMILIGIIAVVIKSQMVANGKVLLSWEIF